MGSIKKIALTIKSFKENGKTVALNTGCYDILSIDHVRFLDFMKKNADIVVIGLENDKSIKLNKGYNRPINTFSYRKEILSQLKSVDIIFEIPFTCVHRDKASNVLYDRLVCELSPSFIATSKLTGSYITQKKARTRNSDIKLLTYIETTLLSS